MPDAPKDRLRVIVDVHLLLKRGNEILLGERINTGYYDHWYHYPAGHMEPDETALDTLVREAREELGIEIHPAHAKLVHTMHQASSGGRIGLFFVVEQWIGEPENREHDKCAGLRWIDLAEPPPRIVPYAQSALRSYEAGEAFSLFGWEDCPTI